MAPWTLRVFSSEIGAHFSGLATGTFSCHQILRVRGRGDVAQKVRTLIHFSGQEVPYLCF